MKKTAVVIWSAALGASSLGFNANAHPLSAQECSEGSDFVRNAASSRENGMDGMTFLTKTLGDFVVIKSFPAEFRWFVKDRQDEDYLLKAVVAVFDNPQPPQVHQSEFYADCLVRSSVEQ